MKDRQHFLFLNIGHFLDHFFLLIFATAAALSLAIEWQLSYGQLIPYSTAGFIAFGLFSLPSGWVADRWSREGMMCVFFIGIGLSTLINISLSAFDARIFYEHLKTSSSAPSTSILRWVGMILFDLEKSSRERVVT